MWLAKKLSFFELSRTRAERFSFQEILFFGQLVREQNCPKKGVPRGSCVGGGDRKWGRVGQNACTLKLEVLRGAGGAPVHFPALARP